MKGKFRTKRSRSTSRTHKSPSKAASSCLSSLNSIPLRSHSSSAANHEFSRHYDALVIGGGIAGAAAAVGLTRRDLGQVPTRDASTTSSLSPQPKKVLVIEKEQDFCFHSTGRSAAIYSEVYGTPAIRVLSTATKPYFYTPKETGLLDQDYEGPSLVNQRSSLWVATQSAYDDMMQLYEETKPLVPSLNRIELQEAFKLVPALAKTALEKPSFDYGELGDLYGKDDGDYTPVAVLLERDAADMDVNAIHTAMSKLATQHGAHFRSNLEITKVNNNTAFRATSTPQWTLELQDHSNPDPQSRIELTADVVVNAAGAWADQVAEMLTTSKVGLEPRIRTVIQFQPSENVSSDVNAIANFDQWPNVFDMHDRFYYKADAGRVLASPCDEILSEPADVQPDELSVAVCVERIQRSSFFSPQHITSKWAGLRTFSKDREFVIGFDGNVDNMIWLAGLGGYGIQTAMGNARAIAGLYHTGRLPDDLVDMGLSYDDISPSRF